MTHKQSENKCQMTHQTPVLMHIEPEAVEPGLTKIA